MKHKADTKEDVLVGRVMRTILVIREFLISQGEGTKEEVMNWRPSKVEEVVKKYGWVRLTGTSNFYYDKEN